MDLPRELRNAAYLPQRLPDAADANGWKHFLAGGYSAVDIDGIFFPNSTREFVVDGGSRLQPGTDAFQLLDGGAGGSSKFLEVVSRDRVTERR